MERFREFGGVVLTKDPSDESLDFDRPVDLLGGRNLVKRTVRGLKRRPGFGALNVQAGAAIGVGSTDPVGAWPTAQAAGGDAILGLDDGTLKLFDGVDSFDQIQVGMTNARPTFAELGGYHLFSGGDRPQKYIPDGDTPSPLGSRLIFEGTDEEGWDGDAAIDASVYKSGAGALKMSPDGNSKTTSMFASIREHQVTSLTENTVTFGLFGSLDGGYDAGGQSFEPLSLTDDVVITSLRIYFNHIASFTEDVEVEFQSVDADGTPTKAAAYGSQTWAQADIPTGDGYVTVALDTPKTIPANTAFAVCFIPDAAETGRGSIRGDYDTGTGWGGGCFQSFSGGAWAGPSASTALNITLTYYLASEGIDMYTNYANASKIRAWMKAGDVSTFTGHVRFKTTSTDYFTYAITSSEEISTDGEWALQEWVRGSRDGVAGDDGVVSDFGSTGSPDWQNIVEIEIVFTSSNAQDVYIDQCILLDRWAPPASNAVFVADGRAFVVDGRTVYYSVKWNPNVFWIDTYLQFPTEVVAVVEAGDVVLFLTNKDAWKGTPLSAFPDYDVRPLDQYGGLNPRSACVATVGGKKGAAWVTKNRGVRFWDGEERPFFISDPVKSTFIEYEANSRKLDLSRSEQCALIFHPRWNELWMFYPTLITAETNVTFAWIFNCETGEWMPLFEWGGSSDLVYATVFRDSNDDLYKMILTDSGGGVWIEGFVGTTLLDDATSKDGYVDGDTTGAMVKGYVEMPFVGGWAGDRRNKDQYWNQINVKYRPATTDAFAIDISYKAAEKESEPDDSYSKEIEVVFGDSWTSLGDRSTTQANANNVVERNVKFEDSVVGHAVAIKVGQFSVGGSVEWELFGTYARGEARGGQR